MFESHPLWEMLPLEMPAFGDAAFTDACLGDAALTEACLGESGP